MRTWTVGTVERASIKTAASLVNVAMISPVNTAPKPETKVISFTLSS